MSNNLELSLLKACCFEGKSSEVLAKVLPSDFGQQMRPVMESVAAICDRGATPDVVTVAEEMESQGYENTMGWISDCSLMPSGDVDSQCKEIKRYSLKRRMLAVSRQIAQWATDEDPDTAYEKACSALIETRDESNDDSLKVMNEMIRESLEDLERRMDSPDKFDGLETGFELLDDRWMGMKNGNLILIAGRPSMGKTTLAMNIIEHSVQQGNNWLFFSMEMSHKELMDKTISSAGRVSFTRMNKADLNEADWPKVTAGVSLLRDKGLFVDDSGGMSVARMRARAYEIKRKYGLHGICVDYLQLMAGEGQNRENEIGGISRGLKGLAKELDVPVIAISQLNRQCEQRPNKRPVNSDLRDSGSLEQDANIITFVYRDEVYNEDSQCKGIAELITRKYRGGRIGTDCLAWVGDYQHFENLDYVPNIDAMIESSTAKRPSREF